MLPRLASTARRLVTDSEFSKRRIVHHLEVPPEKISVIYPGVSRDALVARAEEVGKLSENEPPYAIAYGGNNPRKNLPRLIEAWGLVGEVIPGLSLKIFGAESSLFTLGGHTDAAKGVEILGYLTEKDLALLYRGASLLAYPSLYEGFGLPPLEAMALGVPTVISDIDVFREVFNNSAEFVDPYDPVDIARGVTAVLTNDSLRAQLVSAASELVAHFSWERTAGQLMSVVEEFEDR
jgi:glycosyltransferase involved in cell wall biosynthesis